jgi:hypothetical protein
MSRVLFRGATWFIESRWESNQNLETLRQRIRRGPPRLQPKELIMVLPYIESRG